MNNSDHKLASIISFIIGILLIILPSIPIIMKDYENRNYIKTTGEFLGYEEVNDQYILKYKYMVDEYVYFYESETLAEYVPKIGSKVTIKYNPDNPDESYCNKFIEFGFFIIIGIFFVLGAVLFSPLSSIVWLRDILIFGIASMFMYIMIKYNSFNIELIIPGLICATFMFASTMEFVSYVKTNKFTPYKDIKKIIKR